MTKAIPIKDGTCTCGCDTICPLGRTGEQPRCTESELNKAGIKTIRLTIQDNRMTGREIKESLSLREITQASIAERFNCSPSNVYQIINAKPTQEGKPSLIRQYIADVIGKPFDEVWGK